MMNKELATNQLNQMTVSVGKRLTNYENCLNKALILTVQPEEHLYTRDFVKNFDKYARAYKLQKPPEYKRLIDNFNTLSYEISSLRKGKKSEQKG